MEEEKAEAEEKKQNDLKASKMDEEHKVAFWKHVAEHEEEEAENKKKYGNTKFIK